MNFVSRDDRLVVGVRIQILAFEVLLIEVGQRLHTGICINRVFARLVHGHDFGEVQGCRTLVPKFVILRLDSLVLIIDVVCLGCQKILRIDFDAVARLPVESRNS